MNSLTMCSLCDTGHTFQFFLHELCMLQNLDRFGFYMNSYSSTYLHFSLLILEVNYIVCPTFLMSTFKFYAILGCLLLSCSS